MSSVMFLAQGVERERSFKNYARVDVRMRTNSDLWTGRPELFEKWSPREI